MPEAVSFERYDRLVQLLYQDALAPRPWKNFVGELATSLCSRDASLHIFTRHSDRNLLLVTNDNAPHLTDSYLEAMLGDYFLKRLPAERPMTLDDFDVSRNFLDSALFKRFLAPFGITHILTQDVYADSRLVIRLSADRERNQGDFGPREKWLLQSLTPHIRQALNIRAHVRQAEGLADQFQALLARDGVGCVVIGAQWEILRVNEAASRMLQGSRGFSAQRGHLRLRNSAALKPVRMAIDAAVRAHLEGAADRTSVSIGVPGDGGAPMNVTVKPLLLDDNPCHSPAPAALLLMSDGTDHAIEASLLISLYRLTPGEAKVGALLVRGRTLREVADEFGVSINTVKTHQRAIYDKLGLSRRSQMIKLLDGCAAKLL